MDCPRTKAETSVCVSQTLKLVGLSLRNLYHKRLATRSLEYRRPSQSNMLIEFLKLTSTFREFVDSVHEDVSFANETWLSKSYAP
jgi:hypothetical protein